MEDMNIMRPHFCFFMPSTTPLTSRNDDLRLILIVLSNSSKEISLTSGYQ